MVSGLPFKAYWLLQCNFIAVAVVVITVKLLVAARRVFTSGTTEKAAERQQKTQVGLELWTPV